MDPRPHGASSRRFLRLAVEPDSGVRIAATCESEGVRIEVDASGLEAQVGWDWTEAFVIERSTEADGSFVPIAEMYSYNSPLIFSFIDRSTEPDETYHYQVTFGYWLDGVYHEAPPSNIARIHASCAATGPDLVVSCRPDWIKLMWTRPDWATENGVTVLGWRLFKAEDPEGPFTEIYSPLSLFEEVYADSAVDPDKTYYYYAEMTYRYATVELTRKSKVAAGEICDSPELGPIDVAFVIDNTSSMGESITRLKMNMPSMIDDIEAASGAIPDYRLSLVTPDDNAVNVRTTFSPQNLDAFLLALNDPTLIRNGILAPESTDECLNTAVNGLWECHRIGPAINCEYMFQEQAGNFFPPFGQDEQGIPREALKLVVLITDDVPGGFCDSFDANTYMEYSWDARCRAIRIVSVMVGDNDAAEEVMETYATLSEGWYKKLPSDGSGIAGALDILFASISSLGPPAAGCNDLPEGGPCGL